MDVEPVNGRILILTLNATTPISIFSVYAPTSTANTDKKEDFYKLLKEKTMELIAKHIVITAGDFNARIGKCAGVHEEHLVGQHTFHPETTHLENQTPQVAENRLFMLQHLQETDQIIANTLFNKPDFKKMTYRQRKNDQWGPPYTRTKCDTLDYITIPHRWKNGIKDIESDPTANIPTDHIPLIMEAEFKLKEQAVSQQAKALNLEPATKPEKHRFNQRVWNEIRATDNPREAVMKIRDSAEATLTHTRKRRKKEPISEATRMLIEERYDKIMQGDWQAIQPLSVRI